MNISLVAERSGILPKTIRCDESIGPIPSADRRTNGYRSYDVADVHTLQFIRSARNLGFSVGEAVTCWICGRDNKRASTKVKCFGDPAPW